MQDQSNSHSRRAALKALAAATGAAGLAALPTRWSKPAVMVGAVPAHAQTSCVDWALIFDYNLDDLFLLDWSEDPDFEDGGTVRTSYWACGGGCLWLYFVNGFSTASYTITVFGKVIELTDLGSFQARMIALNRNTLQWEITQFIGNINWEGIGCEDPGDIFNE